MTYEEIIQALRNCAKGLGHDDACENCKVGEIQDRREYIEFAAANVIERLTAENAALRKEIEWKDMVIALAQRKQVEAEAERDAAIVDLKIFAGCSACSARRSLQICDCNRSLRCRRAISQRTVSASARSATRRTFLTASAGSWWWRM